MSRQLGHPDPAALASLRAGLVGLRRGRRLCGHVARCLRCAQVCARLDEVSLALAAAPPATLPAAAERRVLAALALESAARVRQAGWTPDTAAGHAPRPGPGRQWPALIRHRSQVARRLARPRVLAPAVASLIVMCAGGAYALGASPAPQGHPALTASARAAHPRRSGQPATQDSRSSRSPAFMVTDTGTSYREATLPTQVSARLAAQSSFSAATAPAGSSVTAGGPLASSASEPGSWLKGEASAPPAGQPGPAAATIGAPTRPSASLVGCVMRLTGNIRPKLVDLATYQSQPAYVIAIPGEAWVVGVACTASQPTLIAEVRLGG